MSLRSPPQVFMKTLCLTPLSSSYLTVTLAGRLKLQQKPFTPGIPFPSLQHSPSNPEWFSCKCAATAVPRGAEDAAAALCAGP